MTNLFETKKVNVFSNSLMGKAAEITVNGETNTAVITIVQPYAITVSGVGGVKSYKMDQVESGQVKLLFLERPGTVAAAEEVQTSINVTGGYKRDFIKRRPEMVESEHKTLVWLFEKKKTMRIIEIRDLMKKYYPHWGEERANITRFLQTAADYGIRIEKVNDSHDGLYTYRGGKN